MLFVINPATGIHPASHIRRLIRRCLEKRGWSDGTEYQVVVPGSEAEHRRVLREILEDGNTETVVAVGGDGTVMETVSVLSDFPEVFLGIIPNGTGNILATNLGIPLNTEAAIQMLFVEKPREMDLGRITASNGESHHFALIAGAGIDAEIMEKVRPSHKRRMGIFAYVWEGVKRVVLIRHAVFRITADGRTVKARGIGVIVANARNLLGPYFSLVPQAKTDDGLLDVCILRVKTRVDYITTFLQILTRQYNNTQDTIRHIQAREITIDATPALKVEADGTVIGETPLTITALPGKIRIIAPRPERRSSYRRLNDAWHQLQDSVGQALVGLLPWSGVGHSSSSVPK